MLRERHSVCKKRDGDREKKNEKNFFKEKSLDHYYFYNTYIFKIKPSKG